MVLIIDPIKLPKKYKLEHELQKIYFNNKINIKYIPTSYTNDNINKRFFFNKILSILNYSENKIIKSKFYIDHDVIIKPNFFNRNYNYYYFFTFNEHYNWKSRILLEYQRKNISKNEYLFLLDYSKYINSRISACIIDLKLINDLKIETEILQKNIKNLKISFLDELVLSKIFLKNEKNMKKNILIKLEYNTWINNVYVIHFKNPIFLLKENLKNDLNNSKNIINIFKELDKIYKGKK